MTSANADQATYWNAGAGETWAALQDRLDVQLEPLGLRAMTALNLAPGERVLDVGCGAGQTTLQLAEAVGASGAVLGLDISRPLLDVARARSSAVPNASFLEADAQTHPLAEATFDAIFSRFGVMFFSDPVAAFTNLHRALKPTGRLAFVCWRTPPENVFMTLPMAAALPHLPPAETPPPQPGAPGPFAFADADRVGRILSDSGFTNIAIAPHDQKIGSGDLEQTLAVALKVGPLGALLRENPESRDAAIDAVREALRPHQTPQGVLLDSATWIVTATA